VPRQPEGKLVARIKQKIVDAGGRSFKIHGSDEGVQEVGIPDLLICLHGRFVGMEVKQPGERLRQRQRLVLHEIFDAGGVAAVVETVGQAALLLSKLEKEMTVAEADGGLLFNRGAISRRWPENGLR
jgi:hypothetical protein